MAYFKRSQEQDYNNPPHSAFNGPIEDDDADDADWDDLPPEDDEFYEDELSDEDRREARRGRYRVLAGLSDFFGVIAGTVVILVLIALLVSLINWLQADISQSFTLLQTKM